jgi:uncharacterized protein with GYD domain
MSKYVVLVNWTEQGVKAANETVQRAERVGQLAERLGGHMDLLLWTMGRYDLVGVFDMPNDEAFSALALQVGMTGATTTESLRAFTADEVTAILQQVG